MTALTRPGLISVIVGLLAVAGATPQASADAFELDPTGALPLSIAGIPLDDGGSATAPSSSVGESVSSPPATTSAGYRWGDANTFTFNLSLGYADDFTDISMVPASIGVSWFPIRMVSIDLAAEGAFISQPGDDAAGGGLSLMVRWHFLDFERWSIYADFGVGFLAMSEDVPAGASSFVFTPRAGLGASFAITDRTRLLAGARWFHISNAQTASENPGIDMLEGYVGLSIGF